MPPTDKQRRAVQAEDRIALVIDADEAFVCISEHTANKRITDEVDAGRRSLRRLWDSLISERQSLQKGNTNGNDH